MQTPSDPSEHHTQRELPKQISEVIILSDGVVHIRNDLSRRNYEVKFNHRSVADHASNDVIAMLEVATSDLLYQPFTALDD